MNHKVDNGRYILLSSIGEGGYSRVYHAKDTATKPHLDVAIKCMQNSPSRRGKFLKEINLHRHAYFAAGGKGVVRPLRAFEQGQYLFIILEYCPDGDLFSAITSSQVFLGQPEFIKPAFLQLLDSVIALHQAGIYHRDLKPENILISQSETTTEEYDIDLRLTDFGLSTSLRKSYTFGLGSEFYMTPECIAGLYSDTVPPYSSPATDIWALGIILVNLLCCRSPWRVACMSDPSFSEYNRLASQHNISRDGGKDWIRGLLPVSNEIASFLDNIFRNHGNCLDLELLREEFESIDDLYMTNEELKYASDMTRMIASEFMSVPELEPMEELDAEIEIDVDVDDEEVEVNLVIETKPITGISAFLASPLPSPPADEPSCIIVYTSAPPSPDLCASVNLSSSSGDDSDLPITPERKPVNLTSHVPKINIRDNCSGSESDLDFVAVINPTSKARLGTEAAIALSEILEKSENALYEAFGARDVADSDSESEMNIGALRI